MMYIDNTVRIFSHTESPWKVLYKNENAENSIFSKTKL